MAPTPPAAPGRRSVEGILKYQQNRPLSECSGFEASAQVRSETAGPMFLGLRCDALELYTADDRQYLYDLEGRAIRFSTPNEYRFRGVSHQGTVVRKRPRGSGGSGVIREKFDPGKLAESCADAWSAAARALEAFAAPGAGEEEDGRLFFAAPDPRTARARLIPILEKIAFYTPERLEKERARFAGVYQPVPVLPPDHYGSLVLQATEGCSFNTCTFCTLYRGIPFRIRSLEQFDRHIRDALAFHGEGLKRFTQIFLGQANALAIPQRRLVQLMERIREHVEFPAGHALPGRPAWGRGHRTRFLGIGSFLDGFTGLTKSATDYAELRDLGLTRVYLGVESGSAGLLAWLRKPATPSGMLETLRRLKEAGLATDVILLVGVGGAARSREHVDASLDFLRTSPLRRGDRVFLSDLVEDRLAPYGEEMKAKGWPKMSPAALDAQRDELKREIRALGLQPVPYRIEPFAY